MDIAGAFHAGTVGVNQETRRFSTGIEVLVPGENRNDQCVPFLPFVLLIFDDAVALTRNYMIGLFIDVAMGARSFARWDFSEQRAENFHMEPELYINAVRNSSHRRRLKFKVSSFDQHFSRSPPFFFLLSEVELIEINFSRRRLAVASRSLRLPPALIQIDFAARRRFRAAGYQRLHRFFTLLGEDPILRIVFLFVKCNARRHGKGARGRSIIDQIFLTLIVVSMPSEHGHADEIPGLPGVFDAVDDAVTVTLMDVDHRFHRMAMP